MSGSYERPALRYHGGKWRLAPWIIGHFPEHRVYVEPFGGSASVLFRKPRSYGEVYNDLDEEIVNVFRVAQDPAACARLQALLEVTPFARLEFELAYKASTDPVERARRAIIRSFQGFSSASVSRVHKTEFRSNASRNGTYPAMDWARYPGALGAWLERLRGVVIECRDGLEVIRQHDRADALIYADPPYVQATRRDPRWKRNYRHNLDDEQHAQLAEVLRAAEGYVVLSGYRSALYDDLYGGWVRVETDSCTDCHHPGQRNIRTTECLWLSPRTADAAGRLFGEVMEVGR